MKNPLSIVDSCLPARAIFKLEFDEYVPLRLRAFAGPVGSGYLRLGNYKTKLVEICVGPQLQLVRGLTLTSFENLTPWPDFVVVNTWEALPVLATDFEGWKVVDLGQDFTVALRDNQLIIFWDILGICDCYSFGRARFLARDGVLVGVTFVDLAADEIDHFNLHLPQREAPRVI